MPTDKSPKKVYVQIDAKEDEPEETEILMRFKAFAVRDRNYREALKRLMDLANVA